LKGYGIMSKRITKEQQIEEAKRRLRKLSKTFNLDPIILNDFEQGKIKVCKNNELIDLDSLPEYKKMVTDFENDYDHVVYYCVEERSSFGTCLSLLCVGDIKTYWNTERLFYYGYDYRKDDIYMIATYTYNLSDSDCSEFGDIRVTGKDGCLIRIG